MIFDVFKVTAADDVITSDPEKSKATVPDKSPVATDK